MDYEEHKRKALEPIVSYIESAMASYSKEELEARIKKALPKKESEDERIRKMLIDVYKRADMGGEIFGKGITYKQVIAYLEKQKDEVQRQFNLGVQAGREEVMYEMEKEQKSLSISAASEWLAEHVRNYINSEYNEFHKCVEYDGSIDKKRLINDFEDAMQKEQKPAEWSEEDDNALNYIHELISFGFTENFMDAQTAADMREWLNNHLNPIYPQPHWKPSEEQMEMDIDAVVNEAFDKYSSVDGYGQLSVSFNRAELYSFIKKIARNEK